MKKLLLAAALLCGLIAAPAIADAGPRHSTVIVKKPAIVVVPRTHYRPAPFVPPHLRHRWPRWHR
jgi:hypothetical protein